MPMVMFQKIYASVLSNLPDAEEDDEDNDHHLPWFISYFLKQWAPIIPLWTAVLLKFLPNEETFQNNQAVEALFSYLKNHQLCHPDREEEARNDFTKKKGKFGKLEALQKQHEEDIGYQLYFLVNIIGDQLL